MLPIRNIDHVNNMSTNRDVSVGSTAEVLDSIISDYRKHSYTAKNFVKSVVINSANWDTFSYNLFLVGSDISKLIQYSLSNDKARELLGDISNTIKVVGEWFSSLNGLSQQKIKTNLDYLLAMGNTFIKLASSEKSLQEVSLSLSVPTVEEVSQALTDAQELATPLPSDPSMSSSPEVAYLRPYEPSRIQETSLVRKHPAYKKYGGMHPVDAALIDELNQMKIDTKDISKESLDEVWEKALLGRLYTVTQQHKDIGSEIMKELIEKQKSQGLSSSDVSVLEKKNEKKDNLKEILDFASDLLAAQFKPKN